jgi:hypothetical protein
MAYVRGPEQLIVSLLSGSADVDRAGLPLASDAQQERWLSVGERPALLTGYRRTCLGRECAHPLSRRDANLAPIGRARCRARKPSNLAGGQLVTIGPKRNSEALSRGFRSVAN